MKFCVVKRTRIAFNQKVSLDCALPTLPESSNVRKTPSYEIKSSISKTVSPSKTKPPTTTTPPMAVFPPWLALPVRWSRLLVDGSIHTENRSVRQSGVARFFPAQPRAAFDGCGGVSHDAVADSVVGCFIGGFFQLLIGIISPRERVEPSRLWVDVPENRPKPRLRCRDDRFQTFWLTHEPRRCVRSDRSPQE